MKKAAGNSRKESREQLLAENEGLRARLAEAEETLRAIRSGEVDALVVSTREGNQVFTLTSADQPYRVMVESMNEGAAILSTNGTVYYCNQSLADMLKEPTEKIIGALFFQYILSQNIVLFSEIFQTGPEGNRKLELNMRTADGHSIPVRLSFNFLHTSDMPNAIVMIVSDLTEQKKSKEIMAAQKALKERTGQLEATNKELESFSYSVSHDLRSPLRAIDGYARNILKRQGDKFDEETLRKFNEIRLNAQRMGQLIDDLLAFSRLGKKQMTMTEIDLDQLVRDIWKELEVNNPDRNVALIVTGMAPGYGDELLIRQVFFNLLANAFKFTKPRAEARIEVGGEVNGHEVVYSVRDNGVGFDMTYYDKLFGVFQRLHSTEEFEGTGVGLANVQRIAHRHGGRVWAEGKVDEGAIFYFTLPGPEKVQPAP